MNAHREIIVVGAGVVGLSTAIELLKSGLPVRVVAEECPGRTSLAAGAMWGPYHAEPWDSVRAWSLASLERFRDFAEVPGTGVRMASGIEASRSPAEAPPWSALLPEFRPCAHDELPPGFASGYRFAVPLIDMPVYLEHLHRNLIDLGGTVENRTVDSLTEFIDAAAVVNCAGMGAGQLADDPSLRPIRGQHVVLKNPGIEDFFSEDTGLSPDLLCYYPHNDTIVLGGTALDDATLAPDESAAEGIIERCATIAPRLANARIIEHRIGLRPTRPTVRVELEPRRNGMPVIHNYGHGGAGVTLSWGCAQEAAELVGEHVQF